MQKDRLDRIVVSLGYAESREKAQGLIRAGRIRLGGHPLTKPGQQLPVDAALTCTEGARFASRGGNKLQAAFESFPLDVRDKVCLDVGASTGGFTDCLLQHGAAKVIAVDVGKGQLDWRLRGDGRVEVHEGVNARYLEQGAFEPAPVFAVVDVSFISLTLVLPAVKRVLCRPAEAVTLIKPQFEAGRNEVGRGGVVRDDAVRDAVVERIRAFGTGELGWTWSGLITSPLKGPAGNVEYLAHWMAL